MYLVELKTGQNTIYNVYFQLPPKLHVALSFCRMKFVAFGNPTPHMGLFVIICCIFSCFMKNTCARYLWRVCDGIVGGPLSQTLVSVKRPPRSVGGGVLVQRVSAVGRHLPEWDNTRGPRDGMEWMMRACSTRALFEMPPQKRTFVLTAGEMRTECVNLPFCWSFAGLWRGYVGCCPSPPVREDGFGSEGPLCKPGMNIQTIWPQNCHCDRHM